MAAIKYKYRIKNKRTGKYLSNGKGNTTWNSLKWATARVASNSFNNINPDDFEIEKIEMVVVETLNVTDIINKINEEKRLASELKKAKDMEKSRIRIHIQELCSCTVDEARAMIKTGIVVEPIQTRLKVLLKEYDNQR